VQKRNVPQARQKPKTAPPISTTTHRAAHHPNRHNQAHTMSLQPESHCQHPSTATPTDQTRRRSQTQCPPGTTALIKTSTARSISTATHCTAHHSNRHNQAHTMSLQPESHYQHPSTATPTDQTRRRSQTQCPPGTTAPPGARPGPSRGSAAGRAACQRGHRSSCKGFYNDFITIL
jgi:hypothetical protein